MASRIPSGARRYVELDNSSYTSDSKSFATHNAPPSVPFPTGSAYPIGAPSASVHSPHLAFNAPSSPFVRPSTQLLSTNQTQRYPNSNSTNQASQFSRSNSLQVIRRRSSRSKGMDVDLMPRPDINAETSHAPVKYVTTQYNDNPPHSYTNFITVDEGNAGPRYIRSSFYKVPVDESLTNGVHIPFGMVVQPLADPTFGEESVSIVDYGESGPLRCPRCRTYVNPNWIFIQGGNAFVCNLCKSQNPVPRELYCPLDANGNRTDKHERPELSRGVYEFLAPSTYTTRKPVTNNLIFCVEASTACYMAGIFHQVMSSIQTLLDYIPAPELTKICIVTYDNGINFFKVPEDLSKDLSIIHCPDINDFCMPLPKKALFLSLQDEREKITFLIEKIVKHYESNATLQKGITATCFGTALTDCCNMLLEDGGRVLMFATQAPLLGIGKIKRRDDYKIYGTDKERSLYVPQIEEYGEWAKTWLSKRVSVDMFCFSPDYFDLTTIGQVCNVTGGNIYYYPTYNGTYDGERVHYDLSRNLTRTIGYDAVLTIRTCEGISFLDYVLPSGRRPVPEVDFSSIDADTVLNVYLKHEEKIKDDTVSLQVAMLYTNLYGQRVIRVINFKAGTSNDYATIFKGCDAEATAQLIIKKNILNISNSSVPKIRKDLIENLVAIFHSYRIHCSSTSDPGQLVFPEQLKVLPLFFLALFKAHIMRTMGDTRPDDRSFDLHRFIKMPLNVLSNLLYVKIYPIHSIYDDNEYGPGNVYEDRVILGSNIAATDEKLEPNGIYLLDNNDTIYLYVKKNANPLLIQELLGVDGFHEVAGMASFPDYVESYYFTKVFNIIDQLRKNKNAAYQPVKIVTEKDAHEPALLNLLIEDERFGDSYNNFLCIIHKHIQEKL